MAVHLSGFLLFLLLFRASSCSTIVLKQEPLQPIFHESARGNHTVCVDNNSTTCAYWAAKGECFANPAWMMRNCRRSCQACQGGDQAWQLRRQLVANYSNSSSNARQQVDTVSIHTALLNHLDINEPDQSVKLHGTLLLAWNDTRVKWDNKKWGISWLNLLWSQIWVPQLVSVSSPPAKVVASTFANKAVALHFSGLVFVWVDFALHTFASLDYAKYPYDQQTACVRFGDLGDFNLRFVVEPQANDALQVSAQRLRPAGWNARTAEIFEERQEQKLIAIDRDDLVDVATSVVDLCVTVKRDTSYVGVTYMAPCLSTSLITIVAILTPRHWNRMLLLVASIALQTIFLNTLESRLPPSSGKTPLFVKYCSCNMAITCFVVLLEVLLCYMENVRASLPPPRWLIVPANRLSGLLPSLMAKRSSGKISDDEQHMDNIVDLSSGQQEGASLWAPVIRSARFIIFLSTTAFYLLLFLVTFLF